MRLNVTTNSIMNNLKKIVSIKNKTNGILYTVERFKVTVDIQCF